MNVDGQFCLFLAVQLTKMHHELEPKNNTANVQFRRLLRNPRKGNMRLALALQLLVDMRSHGIEVPLELPAYTVAEHAPMLQQYFDIRYGPGAYRLTIFSSVGTLKPIFRGNNFPARCELCLYLWDGHFWGIRCYNILFGSRYYCIDCQRPFSSKDKHRIRCRAKCKECCGIGWGFPCTKQPAYQRECEGCHKIFRNANCFQRHLERKICDKFKRCPECGYYYSVKGDGQKHACYTSRCNLCTNYHREDEPCFVQPIRSPAQKKDFLMVIFQKKSFNDKNQTKVFYDFECSLVSPTRNADEWHDIVEERPEEAAILPDDPNFQLHNVNCVSAMLLCSGCADSEEENCLQTAESSGNCLCGQAQPRMRTWTAADCENPLRQFLNWLTVGLGKTRKCKTFAIAHYGGFVIL